jgi:hypothetical protein
MLRKLLSISALATMTLAPCALYAQQTPTLGELARKEQERRKTLQAPAAKVLTNQDLPRTAAPAQPPAGESAAPVATAKPEKPDEATTEPARDEAWWRQRMSQAREELRRNEMFAEALQTRINSLTNDFSMRDDPYQRAKVAEERTKAILELDRVKADAEANRKKISDIEEEARRASVPPGWLR